MDSIMAIVTFFWANWEALLVAVNGLLVAMVALFLLIPGEQPEKFLGQVVAFLAKFSKK